MQALAILSLGFYEDVNHVPLDNFKAMRNIKAIKKLKTSRWVAAYH